MSGLAALKMNEFQQFSLLGQVGLPNMADHGSPTCFVVFAQIE